MILVYAGPGRSIRGVVDVSNRGIHVRCSVLQQRRALLNHEASNGFTQKAGVNNNFTTPANKRNNRPKQDLLWKVQVAMEECVGACECTLRSERLQHSELYRKSEATSIGPFCCFYTFAVLSA